MSEHKMNYQIYSINRYNAKERFISFQANQIVDCFYPIPIYVYTYLYTKLLSKTLELCKYLFINPCLLHTHEIFPLPICLGLLFQFA